MLTPSQIAVFEVSLFIVNIYVVISYKVILSTLDIFTLYSQNIFYIYSSSGISKVFSFCIYRFTHKWSKQNKARFNYLNIGRVPNMCRDFGYQ